MKTTKKVLSVLLSVLMIFSVSVVAFAEGENWVQLKKSGDALEKGDLYMDLASVKEMYIARETYSSLCDYVTPKDPNWSPSNPPKFNNLSVVACEKLANLYPDLWAAALQRSLEDLPGYDLDDFTTIQHAWDYLFESVKEAHPELGFTYWDSLSSYGYDYIIEEHPEALDAATAAAEEDFAVYENATWYYDSNFTAYRWLKAEGANGENLWYIPSMIEEAFTEYGIEWQPVAADIASVAGEGGYYLNGTGIEVTLSEEQKDAIRQRYEWTIDWYLENLPADIQVSDDKTVHVETEAELRALFAEIAENEIARQEAGMAAYYANFFDDVTLLVNPDEDSQFQISLTLTYTDFDGSYEQTVIYPFVETTGGSAVITKFETAFQYKPLIIFDSGIIVMPEKDEGDVWADGTKLPTRQQASFELEYRG